MVVVGTERNAGICEKMRGKGTGVAAQKPGFRWNDKKMTGRHCDVNKISLHAVWQCHIEKPRPTCLQSKIANLKSFEATFCLQPASIVLFYNRLKAVGWAWVV